jgi:tRNA-Thr(GGU) m(6)t(6)A37 methyltransferase TsaA
VETDLSAVLRQIGRVHSGLTDRSQAPKQGWGSSRQAKIEILPEYVGGLNGIAVGHDLLVLTWLHRSERGILHVHPQDDLSKPLTGVFATRSSDRPNPIGVHRVTVLAIEDDRWLTVQGLEAIDSTPVIDIKPVLDWEKA